MNEENKNSEAFMKAKAKVKAKEEAELLKIPSLWEVTGITREEYEKQQHGNGNYYFKKGHPFENKYFIKYINWSEEYGNGSGKDYDRGELELKAFPIRTPEHKECVIWENGEKL